MAGALRHGLSPWDRSLPRGAGVSEANVKLASERTSLDNSEAGNRGEREA